MKFILHTTYYRSDNIHRDKEILSAILHNINNKYISKIYLLEEDECPIVNEKLVRMKFKGVPSFYDFICNFEIDNVNIICNSDIAFTFSLHKLKNYNSNSKTVYFISRRVGLNLFRYIIFKFRVGNSQDAWTFFNLPEERILEQLKNIYLGKPGNDNALVNIFLESGYCVYNPSIAIELLHFHKSSVRTYNSNDKVEFPYSYIVPDLHLVSSLKDYLVYFVNRVYYKWFQ